MAREKLASRMGFILLSAGCAIGIGNVWKFPYLVGKNGGGAFVLLYLFFLAILGIPIVTMEFAIGRASQKSPSRMYHQLQPHTKRWRWHGYVAMAGNYLLMMFYTTVAGWMLQYFIKTAKGDFAGADNQQIANIFAQMQSDTVSGVIFMAIVVVLGFVVCSFSLQNSVERVSKWMMLALLGIMIALAINSIFINDGVQGLEFYLRPDLNRMKGAGITTVITNAMSQSFFTLSIGIGGMAVFGSYIGRDRALLGEAINVALLDTFVALCSGLIIFPACFAYGVDVTAGPPLIFITLPNVFNNMQGGVIWGSLFFLFLSFAAFTTVIGVFENILACTMDITNWSRKKSSLVNCPIMLLLSAPCAMHPNVLDAEDFILSKLILPIGALVFVIFCVNKKYGWGFDNFIKEANTGKGVKIPKALRLYLTYILPCVILAIFIFGLL